MEFLKKLVIPIVPVQYVAKFLLKKFVNKFVEGSIDFDLAKWEGDRVTLTDLHLNCNVISLTPLT